MRNVKDTIWEVLSDGLTEWDFSEYPFGKVRDVLEEQGYTLGDEPGENCPDYVTDWTNGWELDYWAYIYKDGQYTGYMLHGSFWYGTCYLMKYDVSNQSN